jgi:hypothetical protein
VIWFVQSFRGREFLLPLADIENVYQTALFEKRGVYLLDDVQEADQQHLQRLFKPAPQASSAAGAAAAAAAGIAVVPPPGPGQCVFIVTSQTVRSAAAVPAFS